MDGRGGGGGGPKKSAPVKGALAFACCGAFGCCGPTTSVVTLLLLAPEATTGIVSPLLLGPRTTSPGFFGTTFPGRHGWGGGLTIKTIAIGLGKNDNCVRKTELQSPSLSQQPRVVTDRALSSVLVTNMDYCQY
jgi:hypothetical protein